MNTAGHSKIEATIRAASTLAVVSATLVAPLRHDPLCHPKKARELRVFRFHASWWWFCNFLLALGGFSFTHAVTAQTYPSKPVRFIVSSGAGGSDDFHARVIAPKLSNILGQQFIVDNRTGAGGLIGRTIVANSPPDGYTIMLSGRSSTAARFINAHMTLDLQRALTPAALLVTYSLVLVVSPEVKAKSVSEFIALARTHPGKITVGDLGGGFMNGVASIIFRGMTKIDLLLVGYKEANPVWLDLVAGRIDSFFGGMQPAVPHIAAGRLRALGVTNTKRSFVIPEVPTIAEAGVPGFDAGSWLFLAVPTGTPRPVIERLNSAVSQIMVMPEVRESLMKAGSEPATSTPEELTKRIADATEQFGRIARELGIKPQ